jgi:hypothetical protein
MNEEAKEEAGYTGILSDVVGILLYYAPPLPRTPPTTAALRCNCTLDRQLLGSHLMPFGLNCGLANQVI